MPTELTPIPISPRMRNVLLLVLALAVVVLCWQAPVVPRLLLAGVALAVVLSFPVRLLARIMPRGAAIAVVILGMVVVIGAALAILIPIVVAQLSSLAGSSPQILSGANDRLQEVLAELARHGLLGTTPDQAFASIQQEAVNRAQGMIQDAVTQIFNTLSGAVGTLFQFLSILLVAVYLLADTRRFKAGFLRALPPAYRDDAEEWWHDAGHSLSRYLAGLLVSLAFQGAVSTIALLILHVPYAVLLGLWTAVAAIVPYIGSYIGGIPATIVALFVSPLTAVLTILTYAAINFIDGNLIAPRVQGQAIRVHPLLVFLAVIAGGQIGGLWGALVAVPILAVLRTTWDFLDERLVVREPKRRALPGTALGEPVSEAEIAPRPATRTETPSASRSGDGTS